MIKNEKQCKITKAKIEDFEQAISILEQKIGKSSDAFLELEYDALQGQLFDSRREIEEYEDLKDGNTPYRNLRISRNCLKR